MWTSLKWELEFKSGVPLKKPVTPKLFKDISKEVIFFTVKRPGPRVRPGHVVCLHLPAPEGSGSV